MKVIELPVSELKTALTGLAKVVCSKSSLPVLGSIRVQPQPGGVDLQATDLDSFVTCRLRTDTPADFPPCLISFADMVKLVKTSKDRVALVHENATAIKFRHFIGSHAVEHPVGLVPVEEWPVVPQIRTKPCPAEPGFKEAFGQAMVCASQDASRFILNGACLDVSQSDCHCVVASDGRHLFSANTFHFPFTDPVVIPARKFFAWSGFVEDGDWFLAVDQPTKENNAPSAYIQIQSDRWTFLTRCIEGTYPNWRQVMPADGRDATKVTLDQEAVDLLLDVLPRMPVTDNSDQPISLVLRNRKLILCSHSNAGSQTEIPVPGALVNGSDRHVCLSRRFVTKALRFGFTDFGVQDALSPVLFTTPGKKLVVMPINLGGPTPTASAQPASPETPSQPLPTVAETAAPVPPSAGQPNNPTEQNTPMATASNIAVLPAPERGDLKATNGSGNNGETSTALKAVVEHVERIKINLRDVVSDLNDSLDLLKAAEKEKKTTHKEVESIRATLRSLQKMEL